jgi:hypothetical protein
MRHDHAGVKPFWWAQLVSFKWIRCCINAALAVNLQQPGIQDLWCTQESRTPRGFKRIRRPSRRALQNGLSAADQWDHDPAQKIPRTPPGPRHQRSLPLFAGILGHSSAATLPHLSRSTSGHSIFALRARLGWMRNFSVWVVPYLLSVCK